MSRPIRIYEEIAKATNNTDLARIVAEAFDEAENRYPLSDMATKSHVSERALELTKEIEGVRLEIKEAEGRLRKEIEALRLDVAKEIEGVRLEIKETEGRLQKEIEGVRLEIKETEGRLRKEIETLRLDIAKEIGGLRLDVAKEISGLRLELTREIGKQNAKTVAIITGYITLIAAMFKFFGA